MRVLGLNISKMLNICYILQGTNKVMCHLFVLHCSFLFSLFGKPDVGNLGPGQGASSEGMVVVGSCPEKFNLLKLGVPVDVHR